MMSVGEEGVVVSALQLCVRDKFDKSLACSREDNWVKEADPVIHSLNIFLANVYCEPRTGPQFVCWNREEVRTCFLQGSIEGMTAYFLLHSSRHS